MPAATARQKVLAVIRQRRAATAAEVGHLLNMSTATVRHHLAILVRDGRLVQQPAERSRGRGRPRKLYRLSDRLLGENLAGLSDALLDVWLAGLPEAKRLAALQALGARLGQAAGGVDAGLAAPRRLVQVTERLNALNYDAHWEAGAHGPHVLLGHCPYAAIIGKHPELCAIDAALLAAVAGSAVEQRSKIGPGPGGATHCRFALQEPATPRGRLQDARPVFDGPGRH